MKKLVFSLVIMATLCTTGLFAQSNKEEIDLLQAAIGMDKKAAFAQFIVLEGTQKDAFWTLYDEYEVQRKEQGKKRIILLQKYVDGYEKMGDVETEQALKDMISMQQTNDKLIATYANKMKKGAGVKAAAQFFQLETYMASVVRATILENIPFIGKLDK